MVDNEVFDPGKATPAAVETAKPATPDFSPPIEDQEAELAAAMRSAGAKPQGFDARGYSEGVAKSIDAANEDMRQKYFKDDRKGYERFLGYCSYMDAASIETAMHYEAAQLRHAATAQKAQESADIIANLGKLNSENAMAGQLRKWSRVEEAQARKQALDGQAERNAEEAKRGLDRFGDDGKKAGEVVDAGVSSFKASTYADYAAEAGRADEEWERGCESLFNFNANELGRFKERVLKMSLNNGDPLNVAEAKAEGAVRSAAVGILNGLLANGNHDVFSRWMHRLNGTPISEEVDDGKGGKVMKFDAMKRWCLGGGDLKGLAEAYMEAKMREKRYAKLASQQDDTALANMVQEIRVRADKYLYKRGALTKDEFDSVNKDIDELTAILKDGTASKAVGSSCREAIEHIRSRLSTIDMREDRVNAKMAKMANEADAVKYVDQLHAMGDSTIPVVVFAGDGEAERAKAMFADARSMELYALEQGGQRMGYFKGAAWGDRIANLRKTSQSDYDEQRNAFARARNEFGIHIVQPEEDKSVATHEMTNKAAKRTEGAFEENLVRKTEDGTDAMFSRNSKATWQYTVDGVKYHVTAAGMNQLFRDVANYQRRHADAKQADLEAFFKEALLQAARDNSVETKGWWLWKETTRWAPVGMVSGDLVDAMLGKLPDYRPTKSALFQALDQGTRYVVGEEAKREMQRMKERLEAKKKKAKGK